MKQRALEWTKTVLIILLVLNAMLLIGRLALSQNRTASAADVFDFLRSAVSKETPAEEKLVARSAAVPVTGAVNGENGRCGMVCSAEAGTLYYRILPTLAEALGSASEPESVGRERFEQALGAAGIYLEFDFSVDTTLLSAWLGGGSCPSVSASRYVLEARESGTVTLLFSDGVSFYASDTSVPCEAVTEHTGDYRPNGARFAFELVGAADMWQCVDPCALLVGGMNEDLPVYEQSTPAKTETATALMEAMELNPYVSGAYTDMDGWDVYLFSSGTLRVSPDGRAAFQAASGGSIEPLTAKREDTADAAELARSFLERTVAPFSGEASVGMSGCSVSGGRTVIEFSYYLGGARVTDTKAASFTFENGALAGMEICWRIFTSTGSATSILAPQFECALLSGDTDRLMAVGYAGGRPDRKSVV